MNTENPQLPEFDADQIDAQLAALLTPAEETMPVLFAVPNGVVAEGALAFIPTSYLVPLSTIAHVQALLERGATLGSSTQTERATEAILAHVGDAALAAKLAAHLDELGLLNDPTT